MVAPDSSGSDEEGLYERLRAQVADMQTSSHLGVVRITVSVGVAESDSNAKEDALLGAADAALYRAKDAGRNRVVYASNM